MVKNGSSSGTIIKRLCNSDESQRIIGYAGQGRKTGVKMTEALQTHTLIFRRIINGLCLAYLLLMALYGVLRLVVGDGYPRLSLVNSFAYFLFIPLPILLIVALLARSRVALMRLLPV